MVESLLLLRLALFIGMLVLVLWSRNQVRGHFGLGVVITSVLGFCCLAIAQGFHIALEIYGQSQFRLVVAIFYTLGALSLAAAVVGSFYLGLHQLQGVKLVGRKEQWLSKVYEHAPVAVFVREDGHITYANTNFENIKRRHQLDDPFSDCQQAEQVRWLNDVQNQKYAYQVDKFLMEDSDEEVFVISDITANKMHETFIKKVGVDLSEHGTSSFETMLVTLSELIPNSLIYVGQYRSEGNGFTYLAHKGENQEANVFSEIKLSPTVFYHNQWVWLNRIQILKQEFNNFIAQYKTQQMGGIVLADESGVPVGVILVLLKNEVQLNELALDFLSILSVRMRSEFEHVKDRSIIQKSLDRYQAFINQSNDAIIDLEIRPSLYLDTGFDDLWRGILENAKVESVNASAKELFDLIDGPGIEQIVGIKSIKYILNYVLQSGFGPEPLEVIHETASGENKWLNCSVMSDIEDGRLYRLWISIRDITDSKTHIQNLEHKTTHDELTGLPNRLALLDVLEEKIDQANQFGFKTALLTIDLDRFKEINDALGHHYGDVLLKKIAPRVKPLLTPSRAQLMRLGGDEFAVVLPSIQSVSEAEVLAKQILEKIREPFDLGQLNVEISGSIGITVYPDDGTDTSTLMRCADVAMYKAKSIAGGILYYRNELDDSSPRRLEIMASMGKGLRENEFYMCYQPKISLKDQTVTSAEALIRWQHPELGLVSPGEFIPLAEMSDMIISMTEWIIDQTLQHIQHWRKQDRFIKVSVNVSTRNLLDENLIPYLKSKLDEYQVPAHLLEIEITESALMADPDRALDTLNKISELGVSISVDDFGTGYSSLIYLRQLPLNALKIDITFVRNMCHNEQDEIIVNSIINLSHNLGLVVVAEGAEDKETVDRLHQMQCDQVQGFYFSKPLETDEFQQFCQDFNNV